MKFHQDIAIGIIIIIFCSFFGYRSLQMDIGPAMMPLILLTLMAVLGILILYDGIKKSRAATPENPVKPFITLSSLKTPITMFLLILGYILLFFFAGYYLATAAFLICAMRYLKIRNWWLILLITAGFLAFTYFFLVRQLNISIDPLGFLGSWMQMHRM
jgi:hypothetical protein